MKYVLVSEDLPKESFNILSKYGKVVKTRENDNLLEGLKSHPDMLLHPLPNGDIICDRDNISYYKSIFGDRNVFGTYKSLAKNYPEDVMLNCVTYDKYFIHNIKYTDKLVLDYYKQNRYELINVKQGYTKCSILVANDFLVTSDDGIYNNLKDIVPIYKIAPKQIKLKNFDYGFIGGASGSIGKELFITGDLSQHTSNKYLNEIAKEHGYNIRILCDSLIEDLGSILFF